MNGRFPIAVHIMTLLSTQSGVLTSKFIAGSININPVLVRKELSELIKFNLVASRAGKNGGYTLGRPADKIYIAQIYQAVKPEALLGKSRNNPNPHCVIGKQINIHLDALRNEVEQSVYDKLAKITLADFCTKF